MLKAIREVADAENGKPFDAFGQNGPLMILDSQEKHSSRSVRHLAAIRVLARK